MRLAVNRDGVMRRRDDFLRFIPSLLTEVCRGFLIMPANDLGKTLNSRELNALIHPFRRLDNHTNLLYLAADYATLFAALASTIAFLHFRADWGIAWYWTIPVVALAVFVIGAGQHRLAGLGHEGAHYILAKNRAFNEFVSDWFCMFPVFATTEQYRQIHLGHHEYTNDWENDPELINLGETRMMGHFPMTRGQFIYNFGLRLFWPPTLLRYMWDNIYVTALGKGVHPYMMPHGGPQSGLLKYVRLTSVLGVAYLMVMMNTMGVLAWYGNWTSLLIAPAAFLAVAGLTLWQIPEDWFFCSRLKPVYSNKVTSFMRLTWFTGLQCLLSWSTHATGFECGIYFWLLWMLPLFTAFPYLMLIRDLFQHANADDGKLTNSRVAFCNPVLRWAMFIYGQDIHLTHHLYPAVPHYNLPKLHALLMQHNDEYAEHVVECEGTLFNRSGRPTLLDVIEAPNANPLRQPTRA